MNPSLLAQIKVNANALYSIDSIYGYDAASIGPEGSDIESASAIFDVVGNLPLAAPPYDGLWVIHFSCVGKLRVEEIPTIDFVLGTLHNSYSHDSQHSINNAGHCYTAQAN